MSKKYNKKLKNILNKLKFLIVDYIPNVFKNVKKIIINEYKYYLKYNENRKQLFEKIEKENLKFDLYNDNKEDGSCLIKDIIREFNNCLKETKVSNYGKSFSIDETLSYCSCRTKFIQKIPNKPAGKGILSYCLCKPNVPYLCHIMFYRGKSVDGAKNIGSKIVAKMINENENILKHCEKPKLFMDSFFSNIPLGLILDNNGIDFIATLSSNRKYIPDVIKRFENMENGDVRCFKVCGSKLRFVQIKDKKHDTILLTNYNNTNDVVKVYRRSQFANCEFYEKEITHSQHEYKQGMCGVDVFDRCFSVVNVRRRTMRWTVAYFEVLVNASLVNVFTVINTCYRQKEATKQQKNIEDLPQTFHLNRRVVLYELGKSLCKNYQMKNIENEEKLKKVSFENN